MELDVSVPQIRRMWLENGFRNVRLLKPAKNGKMYVEWCDSGKWRKLKEAVPENALLPIAFEAMPLASQKQEEAVCEQPRKVRRRRFR